jgi:hypothetical protein
VKLLFARTNPARACINLAIFAAFFSPSSAQPFHFFALFSGHM